LRRGMVQNRWQVVLLRTYQRSEGGGSRAEDVLVLVQPSGTAELAVAGGIIIVAPAQWKCAKFGGKEDEQEKRRGGGHSA
jgi:hypothetical protein